MSNPAKAVQSVKLVTSTKEVEQIELFELDGKSYTIPNKTRVSLALKTLDVTEEKGEQAGQSYMLKNLLGAENYAVLLDFEDLTIEDFNTIIELASQVVFGDLESPKADS